MPSKKKPRPGYTVLVEHPQRQRRKETNDCGVLALALACDVSYAKAHAALKQQGRRNREGTWCRELEQAARTLGFRLEKVQIETKTIARLPYDLTRAKHFGRFIVNTTNHFAAIIDGRVEDWSGGRGLRVETVYRVIER